MEAGEREEEVVDRLARAERVEGDDARFVDERLVDGGIVDVALAPTFFRARGLAVELQRRDRADLDTHPSETYAEGNNVLKLPARNGCRSALKVGAGRMLRR